MSAHLIRRSALGAALVLAMSGLAGCESAGGNVSVLQSSSVALAPGSTYAWAPVNDAVRTSADPRIANDIAQERLRTAVESALAAKGFRKVSDPGAAQLLATYHVGLENRAETRVDSYGGAPVRACGFRGCVSGWGMYGPPQIDVRDINYVQGTLILDLVDRASGKLAWRATSDKRVDKDDATQAGLNAILVDMTKSLPS